VSIADLPKIIPGHALIGAEIAGEIAPNDVGRH
jgi:hypothetical protein